MSNPFLEITPWSERFDPPYHGVMRFNVGMAVPITVKTPDYDLGYAPNMKAFDHVAFHGDGKAFVRVWLDGRLAAEGTVIMTQSPSRTRNFRLPRGCKGYTIAVEMCGLFELDALEFDFEVVGRGGG